MKILQMGLAGLGALLVSQTADATDRSTRTTPAPPHGERQDAAEKTDDRAVFLTSDKLFLWRLHWNNHTEMQAGELANVKGQAEGLAEFGEMLMTDHTDAERTLLDLASTMNVDLELTRDEYQKVRHVLSQQMTRMMDLAHESDEDFDRQFLTQIREDHTQAIDMIRSYRKKTKNKDLRAYLDQLLPVLQRHERDAARLLDEVGPARRNVKGTDGTTVDPAEKKPRKRTTQPTPPEEGTNQQEEIENEADRRTDPSEQPVQIEPEGPIENPVPN